MQEPVFSIVIPARNEAGNLPTLVAGIEAACTPLGRFEALITDDGSTDDSVAVIRAMQADRPWLRLLRHPVSGGQSAAVHSGVRAARAPIIATLDGDGQNPPDQLPLVLAPLLRDPDLALIAGQRIGRRDSLSRRLASRIGNGLRRALLRDGTRDTGCGLKAFRRDAYLALPYFNHQHRFLPALFARDGWRIAHIDVTHAPRRAGVSNYSNLQRALVSIRDLFGVAWLIARRKTVQPLPEKERPE